MAIDDYKKSLRFHRKKGYIFSDKAKKALPIYQNRILNG